MNCACPINTIGPSVTQLNDENERKTTHTRKHGLNSHNADAIRHPDTAGRVCAVDGQGKVKKIW
jgi:hypothetical protein